MEKQASNTELNHMKIGIHHFQLEAGDYFKTNGKTFEYYPKGEENQKKCPRGSYLYRSTTYRPHVSAKKYKSKVLKADNIEMVGEKDGITVYEVKYAYKVEITKPDSMEREHQWSFNSVELQVERETKENFFLTKSHPISYHNQIQKSLLNNVHSEHACQYIIGKVEDYAVLEMKLYQYVENLTKERIKDAEAHLQQQKDHHHMFLLFKAQNGYK